MKSYITAILLLPILTACTSTTAPTSPAPRLDATTSNNSSPSIVQDLGANSVVKMDKNSEGPAQWTASGKLEDVSGGSASGLAQSGTKNNQYYLEASFTDLPPAKEGYY